MVDEVEANFEKFDLNISGDRKIHQKRDFFFFHLSVLWCVEFLMHMLVGGSRDQ